MKKNVWICFLLIITIFMNVMSVNAQEYVDKVSIRTAFDTSINKEELSTIKVIFASNEGKQPNGMEQEPLKYYAILKKEENFEMDIINEVFHGISDIYIWDIIIDNDVASLKYDYTEKFTKIDEENYLLQLNIYPHNVATSSTANSSIFEDFIINDFMTDEDRDKYEGNRTTSRTTTTTTSVNSSSTTTQSGGGSSGDPDIIIGEGTTTQSVETTTKSEEEIEEEKRQKEKEERIAKEDKILKIMLIIIGSVLLVGLTFAGIKIYQASKMI